jgi:hypothetical protein
MLHYAGGWAAFEAIMTSCLIVKRHEPLLFSTCPHLSVWLPAFLTSRSDCGVCVVTLYALVGGSQRFGGVYCYLRQRRSGL